jgi:hypothetical protein
MYVEYTTNNSGGSWWLSEEDWKALEAAGWKVEWRHFLGTSAVRATRQGLKKKEAIDEWKRMTGQNPKDIGCECCGPPHNFYVNRGEPE